MRKGAASKQSDEQAFHWVREAALQGHAKAQNLLGVLYETAPARTRIPRRPPSGSGARAISATATRCSTSRSPSSARTRTCPRCRRESGCYAIAAEAGQPDAQLMLGRRLRAGAGVPKNPEESMLWIQRAADQGHGPRNRRAGDRLRAGTRCREGSRARPRVALARRRQRRRDLAQEPRHDRPRADARSARALCAAPGRAAGSEPRRRPRQPRADLRRTRGRAQR